MSSILEALKKLEDEKAARRSGSGNLTGKVARTGQKPRTTPAWLIPGVMLAVAAVSVLGTYIMMSRTPSPSTGPAPVQIQMEAARPSAGQIPLTQLPTDVAPATDARGPRQPAPLIVEKKSGGVTSREAAAPPKDAAKPASSLSADPSKSGSTAPEEPMLTVVGIAWQKDTALRMAIVNGEPVREGGVINGATVREILPDRVRLIYNGRDIEILMGK